MTKVKPGDVVRIGHSLCLIADSESQELVNIILTKAGTVRMGSIKGSALLSTLESKDVLFNLKDLLEQLE